MFSGTFTNNGLFVKTDAELYVRQLTAQNGQVTLAKSYAPYGEVTLSSGSSSSPFAYTGEQMDATGLTYLRARYYSPLEGRFMSRDTWEGSYNSPQSLNRWNYTESNPINYTDPSGHVTVSYDRQTAVNYAKQYAFNANVQMYGVMGDSDCTSFVSQALRAGGLKDEDNWYFKARSIVTSSSGCSPGGSTFWSDCGSAWALTDELYDYLVNSKGFPVTRLRGGEVMPGKYLPKSPEWIFPPHLAGTREGDVVFYSQDTSDWVIDGGTYNHAAFVIGWGVLTDVQVDEYGNLENLDLHTPFQAPMVADHSGPYSDYFFHSINDTESGVNEMVIVHIPDQVYYPDVLWSIWGCDEK